jgi:transcriptional regulator with XRE-family HTH domain
MMRQMSVHSGSPLEEVARSAAFTRGFCTRVRAHRLARGFSRAEMARALGVTIAAYEKYETRSPLPHHLIEPFAVITGADLEELFERGDDSAPMAPTGTAVARS